VYNRFSLNNKRAGKNLAPTPALFIAGAFLHCSCGHPATPVQPSTHPSCLRVGESPLLVSAWRPTPTRAVPVAGLAGAARRHRFATATLRT
jgi:hypothetical protein